MTAQILSSELSNLIQESKRKNTELRNAAEKSLEELKGLRATSEAQIAADLSNRSNFITPLLLACSSKNGKFTGIAIVCLQRLVVSRALPRSRLKEVLEAFRDAAGAGLDVQLKILQALPSLLSNYGEDVKGDLLAAALNICSTLQASKNAIVNNTAAATLQQLVVAVFDKVVTEDKRALELPTVAEAPVENGIAQVRTAAYDAYRVFNDICLLTEAHKPKFLRVAGLPQTFGLELIESVLTNHADIFLTHPEQGYVLKVRVMPFIISSLSEKLNFATTVRVVRVLYTLLRRHLAILSQEGEMALGLLTHMLDQDTALWKRALCMELLRGIFAEAGLLRQIFSLYDAQPGRKAILRDLVAAFVKISTEKPSIIGLGSQSSMPSNSQFTVSSGSNDQAVLEASGIPGIISGPTGGSSDLAIGISTQWSSMRIPCIDQLDKADAPPIPETYIYSLTLTCITSFSEGLAKFILPLTVPAEIKNRKKPRPSDSSKGAAEIEPTEEGSDINPDSTDPKQVVDRSASYKKTPVPINPLVLERHPAYKDVKVCAAIVDTCWPAILATCSSFLYASLDADYYHGLVRSFQKFTHVAGLLRLSTPRDAFLTTLGKAAVPPHVLTTTSATPSTPATPTKENSTLFSNARGLLSVENIHSPGSTSERTRKPSMDSAPTSLNTRNLLCLRALLNLGIALGPTLDNAWVIILETLQQADFVLFTASRGSGKANTPTTARPEIQQSIENSALMTNFGLEIKAVEIAATRLFESTIDFPNDSFVDVITALCRLFEPEDTAGVENAQHDTAESPPSSRKPSVSHRRVHSISVAAPAHNRNQEDFFALAKLGEVSSINIDRLMAFDGEVTGWNILTEELILAATNAPVPPPVRIRAGEILVHIVIEAATSTMSLPDHIRGPIQFRLLSTFRRALQPLRHEGMQISVSANVTDIDIHKIILDGLKSILEQCGETLINGWDITFEIIGSVFMYEMKPAGDAATKPKLSGTRSARLIRPSFNSLQLICSDFLSSLPSSCFLILVDILYDFCSQEDDLNICLTTVTFFWVLSDFISNKIETFSLGPEIVENVDEQALTKEVSMKDDATSDVALWLLLLLRLTSVTTDFRLELRNSAIQTLLRIFDAYGDRLNAESWSLCIQSVIFKMLSAIEMKLQQANDPAASTTDGEKSAWIETTVVILNGISGLLASYLNVLTSYSSFNDYWRTLLDHFTGLLALNILEVNTAIYEALRQILAQSRTNDKTTAEINATSLDLVWALWSKGLPPNTTELKSTNQECLLAYVTCLQELYRLMRDNIDVHHTQRLLHLLRETVEKAKVGSYSADVEYLTPLQAEVLESMKKLRTDIPGVPAAMISQVADFVALPFVTELNPTDKQQPTYVALSKASMSLLETLILSHASDNALFTQGALFSSLTALSRPIVMKYDFAIRTRSLAPWRQATTTSLAILQATLPMIPKMNIPDSDVRSIWDAVIKIANGITSADCTLAPDSTSIIDDQTFDTTSFLTIRDLITPALGNPLLSDKTRRAYTSTLFTNSLIIPPDPYDLPKMTTPVEPLLSTLYTPRKGRTLDPAPIPRQKMSYTCLDELVSLVQLHDSSPERIKLAQAAAPYLILRAGLTLRAYVADQPLRGHMPQPLPQRKELLYILKAMVELRCEPDAIPDVSGVESENRKHLQRLYPLFARAVRAAARDQLALEWIGKALDVVGGEFGL